MAMRFEAKDAKNVENATSAPYLRDENFPKNYG